MNLRRSNKWSAGVAPAALALAFACGSTPALAEAQEQSSEEPADGSITQSSNVQINEIVVTAEKRASSIQRTPIAITAFDQAKLDSQGVDDLFGIVTKVPSMHLSSTQGSAWVFMRGVGNSATHPGADNGVAFHYDGVYLGFPSGSLTEMWDVERVEVLRGPQGTLYGRNSIGGTVNVISKKASLAGFEAKGDVQIGNYNATEIRAAVNAPLTDSVAVRFAFLKSDRDGFQDNLEPGRPDLMDDQHWMLRGSLTAELGDYTTIVATGTTYRRSDLSSSIVRLGEGQALIPILGPGGVPVASVASLAQPKDVDWPWSVRVNDVGQTKLQSDSISLQIDQDLGPATLRVVSAYYDIYRNVETDWDATEIAALTVGGDDSVEQKSVEVQLLSNATTPFQWIVGASYFDMTDRRTNEISRIFPGTVGGIAELGVRGTAVFGQGSYLLTDAVKLTVGGRYSWDDKDNTFTSFVPPLGAALPPQYTKANWGNWSGKVGLDWFVANDSMIYASANRGYKSGAINALDATQSILKPEVAYSYELGTKNKFADGRVILNVTAYHAYYKDLQVNRWDPNGGTNFVLENAADAKVYGIEADGEVLIGSAFRIDSSVGYTHARYKDYNSLNPRTPGLGGIDVSNNPMIQTPEWRVNVGAEYTLDTDVGSFTLRGDMGYTSRIYFSAFKEADVSQAGWTKVDARLTYRSPDDQWYAELWGKNLLDKTTYQSILVVGGPLDASHPVGNLSPPLTFGLRAGFQF